MWGQAILQRRNLTHGKDCAMKSAFAGRSAMLRM
jgi:hypothetical protein